VRHAPSRDVASACRADDAALEHLIRLKMPERTDDISMPRGIVVH
jgi:hypothetical protein